jgi:hypothetical protein
VRDAVGVAAESIDVVLEGKIHVGAGLTDAETAIGVRDGLRDFTHDGIEAGAGRDILAPSLVKVGFQTRQHVGSCFFGHVTPQGK